MRVTEHIIAKTPTLTKRTRLNDGDGLYLIINPNGSKWWRFDYQFDGKRKTLSMGVYPKTDLTTARENRDKAIKLLASGINPSDQKKAAKITERAANKTQSDDRFVIDNDGALSFKQGRRLVVLTKAETMELSVFLECRKKSDAIARGDSNSETGAQDQKQALSPSQDTQSLLQSRDKTSRYHQTTMQFGNRSVLVEVRKKNWKI